MILFSGATGTGDTKSDTAIEPSDADPSPAPLAPKKTESDKFLSPRKTKSDITQEISVVEQPAAPVKSSQARPDHEIARSILARLAEKHKERTEGTTSEELELGRSTGKTYPRGSLEVQKDSQQYREQMKRNRLEKEKADEKRRRKK